MRRSTGSQTQSEIRRRHKLTMLSSRTGLADSTARAQDELTTTPILSPSITMPGS